MRLCLVLKACAREGELLGLLMCYMALTVNTPLCVIYPDIVSHVL